jgi:hypothetical protein
MIPACTKIISLSGVEAFPISCPTLRADHIDQSLSGPDDLCQCVPGLLRHLGISENVELFAVYFDPLAYVLMVLLGIRKNLLF